MEFKKLGGNIRIEIKLKCISHLRLKINLYLWIMVNAKIKTRESKSRLNIIQKITAIMSIKKKRKMILF